jgi:8-oxo-dGTP diphosphatase
MSTADEPSATTGTQSAPVGVAVGVVIRSDGRFLLAQRPAGKPMTGYWEFPGGKLEPHESVIEALHREFQEELGIQIEKARPWAIREFVYPHATVCLHFWKVLAWQGEPQPLEGQALRWESLENLTVEPWLPGALPLKRWLALPAIYAISQASELGVERFLECLDERARCGEIGLLQLREKELDAPEFARLFGQVMKRAHQYGFKLLVNSVHPESYWTEAHGVHLTSAALHSRSQRPDVQWCAASCHAQADLIKAAAIGADFAVLGPVGATPSHPDARPLGWEAFENLCRHTPLPVYALGGMTRADLECAQRVGAQGVALMRAIWPTEPEVSHIER